MARNARLALALGLIGGAAIWGFAMEAASPREAWDVPAFWSRAYPAALILCALLGGLCPDRPWRWALAAFIPLPFVIAAVARDVSLFPLGVVLVAGMALPGIALAYIAAAVRRQFTA